MSNFITAEGQMKGSYWRIWQEGGYGHEIVEAVDLQGALYLASLYFPDPSFGKVHAVPEPLGWVQGRDFGDESPLADWPKEIPGTWKEPEEGEGTPAGDLLQRTADIVNGARNRTHGDKERSFAGIAKGWQRTFGWEVKGSDVARAMIVLKEQRLRHGEQTAETLREHVEDICGYWAIYYELRRAEMEDA